MQTLIMATNNAHKLREIRQMLGGRYKVRGLADIGCHDDIPETAATLKGNALQKARYVWEHYGLQCFADDTGLEVDALDGAPGIFTARFGAMNGYGDDHNTTANIRCLMDRLQGVEPERRTARFRTVIALVGDGGERLFEGKVEGRIVTALRGTDGFGYDPVFEAENTGLTFAEMGPEQKNKISHRGRAIRELTNYLSLCEK